MAHSDDWNAAFEALPTNDNYGYELDNYLRTVWRAVRERMEIDHYWKATSSQADDGKHKKITLPVLAADPTEIASGCILYTKDVDSKAEIFVIDENGNVIQITSGGILNVTGANTALTSILNEALKLGRDADNYIDFGTDDQLDIKIGGVLSELVSISQGVADNDKLVSQGYVDDADDVAQRIYTSSGSFVVNTNVITPLDNTIPQITEGTEFLTASITPTSATNILLIECILNIGAPNRRVTAHLHQDAVANALVAQHLQIDNYAMGTFVLRHRMVAGTDEEITFKLRAGTSAYVGGNLVMNGSAAAGAYFGGVCLSSISITELYV